MHRQDLLQDGPFGTDVLGDHILRIGFCIIPCACTGSFCVSAYALRSSSFVPLAIWIWEAGVLVLLAGLYLWFTYIDGMDRMDTRNSRARLL